MSELGPGDPGWHERYLMETLAGSIAGLMVRPGGATAVDSVPELEPERVRDELHRLCDNEDYWQFVGEMRARSVSGGLSPDEMAEAGARVVELLGGRQPSSQEMELLRGIAHASGAFTSRSDRPQGSQ